MRRPEIKGHLYKDLDLFDMILQVDENEERYCLGLSNFLDNTPTRLFENKSLRRIAEEAYKQCAKIETIENERDDRIGE
jgi:hypothetical protein